ncbi:hypothetical protein PHYBOEH_009215 [Phytophthora boehmeriae]|uniref:Uncharacterized protein n=1 Tax=Phytophthora boehmeriae TaxID=109152 RepID=A0A8T1X5Y0_9STRA|nr:hypothetical protein PHYBOEH_009215 [Phytophthora boehmeriae]
MLPTSAEASAPSSPASARALLSLMQSASSSCSPTDKTDAESDKSALARPKVAARRPQSGRSGEKKPKKPRKRTYYMRKEELGVLSEELLRLEAQMAQYKQQNEALDMRHKLLQREEENAAMRHAIHTQRLAFANTQSMISQFMRVQQHSPFETFIQLGKDPVERHTTLLAMKRRKLHDALQFLVARRRFMDPSRAFADNQKFENVHGDFCYMGFDITPFVGVQDPKTVFDELLNFSYSLEISLSELLGDITIRENDDHWDPSVSQQRLVTNVANLAEMETNTAMFAEYHERDGPATLGVELPYDAEDIGALGHGEELGVLACDFVNEDELYPYIPGRRIRQDVTVLMLVSTCMRPKVKTQQQQTFGRPSQVEMERVVILTRWSLLRIRKSNIQLPFEATQRLRNGMEQVGEAMLNNLHYTLNSRRSSTPSRHLPTHSALSGSDAMLPPLPSVMAAPPATQRY